MNFTSTDSSTVRIVDITGCSPGILTPPTTFSATSSTFMTAASESEYVELLAPGTGTGGTGEHGWE